MNKELFKSILNQAMHVIIETEANKNYELNDAFYDFYEDLAPVVFPTTYSEQRLKSPGFKLYVQQVLDLVYELNMTTEARNNRKEKAFDVPIKVANNVLNFSDFRKLKNGKFSNGVRAIKTN